ncbi:MAG: beta propeller repeat protein, partial [Sulfobacillus sp.]
NKLIQLMAGGILSGLMIGCGTQPLAPHASSHSQPRPHHQAAQPLMLSRSSISQQLTHVSSSPTGATWLWGPSAIWYRPTATASWRSIAPSTQPIDDGWIVGQQAWFAIQAKDNSFVLYHTGDGGSQWQKTPPLAGVPVGLSWPTRSTGFLLTTNGMYTSYHATLWETTTGGVSWKPTPVSISVTGRGGYPTGVAFASPMSGWMTGSSLAIGTAWLFHTTDKGHRWVPEPLPLPPHTRGFSSLLSSKGVCHQILIPALLFTDQGNGLATVLYTRSPVRGWQYSSLIPLSQTPILSAWDFVSTQSVWVATVNTIIQPVPQPTIRPTAPRTQPKEPILVWHSVDGGTHWTSTQPAQTTGLQGLSISMSSSRHGYLILTKTGSTDVLYTHDGGHRWQQLFIRSQSAEH